jgi:hypothetical protein
VTFSFESAIVCRPGLLGRKPKPFICRVDPPIKLPFLGEIEVISKPRNIDGKVVLLAFNPA